MSDIKYSEGIYFKNIRINSIVSESGVFSGDNLQCLWSSQRRKQSGFGEVSGDENSLENPCSIVTDPGSSSEILEYFKKLTDRKFGGCEE